MFSDVINDGFVGFADDSEFSYLVAPKNLGGRGSMGLSRPILRGFNRIDENMDNARQEIFKAQEQIREVKQLEEEQPKTKLLIPTPEPPKKQEVSVPKPIVKPVVIDEIPEPKPTPTPTPVVEVKKVEPVKEDNTKMYLMFGGVLVVGLIIGMAVK